MILDVVKRLAKALLDRIKTLLFNDHVYHLGEEFGLPTISPSKVMMWTSTMMDRQYPATMPIGHPSNFPYFEMLS